MISPTSFQFLNKLKKNNNKEWFDANKDLFTKIKNEQLQFTQQSIDTIASIDSKVKFVLPEKAIFRIYRDVRFSKNKDPYKTHLSCAISADGKMSNYPGYYIHVEPKNCFIGIGIYQPDKEALQKIRQELAYNHKCFEIILQNKKFQNQFPKSLEPLLLKRVPKPYLANDAAANWLKYTGWVVFKPLEETLFYNNSILKEIKKTTEVAKPFMDFLYKALD